MNNRIPKSKNQAQPVEMKVELCDIVRHTKLAVQMFKKGFFSKIKTHFFKSLYKHFVKFPCIEMFKLFLQREIMQPCHPVDVNQLNLYGRQPIWVSIKIC